MNHPEYVVIHTTASKGGTAALIDADHRQHRGFSMIGYHWVVLNGRLSWAGGKYDPASDGRVEAGRPERLIGAHAPGVNGCSVGVAFVAHPELAVTEKQLAAGLELVRKICRRYGIPPERVIGHREVPGAKTVCPLLDMDEFRAALSA